MTHAFAERPDREHGSRDTPGYSRTENKWLDKAFQRKRKILTSTKNSPASDDNSTIVATSSSMDVILPFRPFSTPITTRTTSPISKYRSRLARTISTWIVSKDLGSLTDTWADWEDESISTKLPRQPWNSPPRIRIWSPTRHVSRTFRWYADLTASKSSQLISCKFSLRCGKIDCSNGRSCSSEGFFSGFKVCAAGASKNSRPLEWNLRDPDLWKFSLNGSRAKDSASRRTGLGLVPFRLLFLSFWMKRGTTARVTRSPCLELSTTSARSFWYRPLSVILTHVARGRDNEKLSPRSHSRSTSSMRRMPRPWEVDWEYVIRRWTSRKLGPSTYNRRGYWGR